LSDRWIYLLIGFAAGAVLGAVVTLFTTPMSGKDLQDRIRREAETEWQKARAEYHKNAGELQRSIEGKLDDIKSQLTGMVRQGG
jgi:gas vesicle protein